MIAASVLRRQEWPVFIAVLSKPGEWRVRDLQAAIPWIAKPHLSDARAGLIRDGVLVEENGCYRISNNPSLWGGKHMVGRVLPNQYLADLAGKVTESVTPPSTTIEIPDDLLVPDLDLLNMGCTDGGEGGPGGTKPEGEQGKTVTESVTFEAGPTERKVLNVLKSIPDWPYDYNTDLAHIRDLAVDYPTVDLLAVVDELKGWLWDNPLTKKSNPRSRFRNFCRKRQKWDKEAKERRTGQDRRQEGGLPRGEDRRQNVGGGETRPRYNGHYARNMQQ
jgi:hypothetical protein